ncbi:excinuclease ABC subunit A [Candidatus Amesbacteria bacterium RIFOXYB1_FULL_44_23]|uniref:UvrABC system protein A n=1 Tax=Candidatus Amesbacteria bacterium RIFOXYB1_FULL_44_23 TaxID=1797263 RepID=A0A1F4ZS32_9BACT|nr:MAG: excinuclease ABC subunit A [Candidatus Amesbacteria bacterium RIFOXYB1_FULL_44_23]
MGDFISIHGAREHNLKNVDLELPKNKLVVFTGLSGSGKSSLAFDTIYAEGQRRYVESLSSYARQFLGVMDKPDVDQIDGLSPAISIDQKSASHNPRSTVGTVTEIYDYLRLLYARIGHPHCPVCGREIAVTSVQQIVDQILVMSAQELAANKTFRFLLLSPVIRDRKGEYTELFSSLRQKGFQKVRVDGKIIGLDENISLLKNNKHVIDVVVDRVVIDKQSLKNSQKDLKTRLYDSVESATKLSEGLCILGKVEDKSFDFPEKPTSISDHLFSERFACPVDNLALPEIEPRLFSFNSPHGACPTCTGLGTLLKIDENRILNPNLTVSEGGILPYANTFTYDSWFAQKIAGVVPIKIPIGELTAAQKKSLLYGFPGQFEGIIPNLERRYKQTESDFIRAEIEKYMRKEICPTCEGQRLKPEALKVTIEGKSIVQVTRMSISQSLDQLSGLSNLSARELQISAPILKEIKNRLGFLVSVGLDYLTLDRTATTLAGGEAQRIRLASQIGSGLSGVLYVLDEPSIGLHQRDNQRLIDTLKHLRDLGNSVIVVEHDREMMLASDFLVDFGPGAGERGGQVVSQGTPQHVMSDPQSLTGRYLSDKKKIEVIDEPIEPNIKPPRPVGDLIITGVSQHNLKNVTARFPLGKFIVIAGVSGSGKSTLLIDVLYQAIAGKLNPDHREKPGKYDQISVVNEVGQTVELTSAVNRIILVDQSPIGRTPRSNPATYTGLFTHIRDIFTLTPEARVRGYKPGRFSFNVKGGRCENCQGEGQIKIEMQFLPDIYVNCDVCKGSRYNSETLEVHYKGKNIAEVLNLTVEEALEFFKNIPVATDKLQTLKDVGLDYIRLGQPAPSLSGGEAQRVKLATELSKKATGKTIYILDEPTTGLHFADLERLLNVLKRLQAAGNTVVVIEHNLDVIKNADWIIELGPEGGDKGGQIIATATPKELAKISNSPTGKYL